MRLRTVVDCTTCPDSLVCAGTPVFHTPQCEQRAREWHETALPLCLLTYQLVERPKDFVPVEPTDYADNESGDCIRCPRCENTMGGYRRTYDLNIESVFQLKSKITQQHHHVWCHFCGLDLTRTLP
jgi:hypothetical protein